MTQKTLWLVVAGALLVPGCLDDKSTTDDVEVPEVDLTPAGNITTTLFQGSVSVGLGTPAMSFNQGGAFRTDLERTANTTGYVIELVWSPEYPTNEELALWVRDAAAGVVTEPGSFTDPVPPVASVEGTGPLRLVVPIEDLEDKPYSVLVRATSGPGVAYEQTFDLHITQFEGLPLDPEHSGHA